MPSVIRRASDLATLVADWRALSAKVGFVPTMGALHEGHASLVRAALEECNRVIVSIFVNPLQFDRPDDLERYPRVEKADIGYLADLGVHAVFVPAVAEIYPEGHVTRVVQSGLVDRLCGASRPGHFEGVLTVVLQLFNMVRPDRAYFGLKDYQQVAVIRRMVRDLHVPIEIRALPTLREKDGLAMSSRNALLEPRLRALAPRLRAAMIELDDAFAAGETSVARLTAELRAALAAIPDSRLDYAEIVDPDDLGPRAEARAGDLLAVALFLGPVRLIDNLRLGDERGP